MTDTATVTRTSMELQRPSMWTCVFLNDDYTPMEFVTEILIELFHQSRENAVHIMLQVHNDGKSSVGSYPKDIAFLKSDQSIGAAIAYQYPLQVIPTEL